MSFHDTANGPTDMHGPYSQVFANDAARTGDATVYTAAQSVAGGSLNPIIAYQSDTGDEYILSNHSPTTWSVNGGGGGGEANLGANVGATGAGTAGSFRDKTGVTLNFRRLVQSGAVTITENADDITIDTPASSGEANTGANVGVGDAGVFRDKTGTTLNFRRLVGAGAATITENADTITISTSAASGEANTASNVGTGVGTFKQKAGVDLEMRSVTGTGVISATLVTDDIQISSTAEANTAANVGGGVGNIFRDKTGTTINLRTLVQGASMLLTQAADTITIALGALTQTLNASNQDVDNAKTVTYNAEFDNGNSGAADTITWTNGQKQLSTLTADTTYTFVAPAGPCNLLIRIVQDATGSWSITWPASVRWVGGTPPAISSGGPNTIHIVSFYFDGTNYYGVGNLSFS